MYLQLRRLNSVIVKLEEKFISLLLGVIVLIMTLQVLMRYVFQNPLTWTQELSILLLVYLSFFSADVVLYRKGHIGITYFVELLKPDIRKYVQILVYALIIAGLCMLIPKTYQLISMQSGHVIAGVLPMSKSWWILPIGISFPLMVLKNVEMMLAELTQHAENNVQKEYL